MVKTRSISKLAAIHLIALALGKEHYKKADAALDELLEKAKAGDIITLPRSKALVPTLRGKKFRVSDKFAERNSIGVGLNARRFELEEITSA